MTKKEKTRIQKEIVDSLKTNPHGRLLLAPRVGKTKLIIDLIKRDKPESILWVTPSAELADTGITEEFSTWKAKRYIKKLNTTTYHSLSKVKGFYDWIVLDEEQHLTRDNSLGLRTDSLNYNTIVSMTGTPTKHKEKIDLYVELGLKPLYKLTINSAVDIGLLSNYDIKVLEIDLSNKKDLVVGTKTKTWKTSEQMQYHYLDSQAKQAMYQKRGDTGFRIRNRMRFIYDSPSKDFAAKFLFEKLEGRKLIFCSSIDQANSICSFTYHSKTDNVDVQSFISGDIDEIAMVNAGGTGFTYKAIDNLIMVQCDSDKNGLSSQKICRTLLQQKGYHATIWILCLIGTQDEKWAESTLKNFDKKRVEYLRFKNMLNESQ